MVLSRDAVNGMNMYMYTERTARNCHSCFSGLSVVRPNTTHERTGVKIYENYTHKGVCPAGMFSRAYSTSTYLYLCVVYLCCEREELIGPCQSVAQMIFFFALVICNSS
jgi:hypothetical protein